MRQYRHADNSACYLTDTQQQPQAERHTPGRICKSYRVKSRPVLLLRASREVFVSDDCWWGSPGAAQRSQVIEPHTARYGFKAARTATHTYELVN